MKRTELKTKIKTMKIRQTLQKIHNHSKLARYALYTLLYAVFTPFWLTGILLFWITRPLVALSHLLMGNFHTAKEKITELNPLLNLRDVF
ncbi:hypothetical protein [Pleomorphovibrio marinus]|uniref:hypothetical protein n=1 Tax=Pleomorphovibrio marinus TaxID=2164132 RepID=UPI000E0C3916|nr:hypothetical protein [Pleomorphovibrio marinus]